MALSRLPRHKEPFGPFLNCPTYLFVSGIYYETHDANFIPNSHNVDKFEDLLALHTIGVVKPYYVLTEKLNTVRTYVIKEGEPPAEVSVVLDLKGWYEEMLEYYLKISQPDLYRAYLYYKGSEK